MTPPIESFPASHLRYRIQVTAQGKRRKRTLDLAQCELMELVQYSCHLEGRPPSKPLVVCDPIVRLFRKLVPHGNPVLSTCGLMTTRCGEQCLVETTALETVRQA